MKNIFTRLAGSEGVKGFSLLLVFCAAIFVLPGADAFASGVSQTITFGALADKTYGDVDFTVSATVSSSLDVSFAVSGACSIVSTSTSAALIHITSAGTCTTTASQSGDGTYDAAPDVQQSFNISKKALSVSGTVASDKVYDGTNIATLLSSGDVSGFVAGETVGTSSVAATFDTKAVGVGKVVTVHYVLADGTGGGLAANYSLTDATTTANISTAPLIVTVSATNKQYDGGVVALATLLDNRAAGDSLTVASTSATFADKFVGVGKLVTVLGLSISGTDSGNYTLATTSATTTANITQKVLTATGISASNKPYDGNTGATLYTVGAVPVGVIGSESASIDPSSASASFDTSTVGVGKTVTVSGLALSGPDAGNYTLTQPSLSANVTPLTVNITGVSINNKVYDGGLTATITGAPFGLTGVLVADVGGVSIGGAPTAVFVNKTVRTGKSVIVSGFSLGGSKAVDYTIVQPTGLTANITTKTLNVSESGNANKTYDGTDVAAVTFSDDRVASDVFTVFATSTFNNKNVGVGKPVHTSIISISGTDAQNYTLATTTFDTTANVSQKTINVTSTGINKVYDKTTNATVTLSDDRVAGDTLLDSYVSASYLDYNVGVGKNVHVVGISISGADSTNYSLSSTTSDTTADITTAPITVAADAGQTKIYGTTDPVSFTYSTTSGALYSGDAFSGSLTRVAGENVGNYAITQGSLTAGSNYNLTFVSRNFSITQRPITVTAATNTKVYDGTTVASTLPTITSGSLVGGDTVGFIETYDTRHVGGTKTITPSGIVNDSNGGANYSVTFATSTGVVSAAPLTITAVANIKTYDNTTTAAAIPIITSGALASGDTANFIEAYSTNIVGNNKTLTPSGTATDGNSGNDYSYTFVPAALGTISQLTITGSVTASDKVYDSTTSVAIATTNLYGVLGSNDVHYTSGVATFADRHVGVGKLVTVTGLSLAGTDATNYTLATTTATTTATITARPITVTATSDTRYFNDTTNSSASTTITTGNLVGTDTYGFSQVFDDKTPGARSLVPYGSVSDGNNGNDYTITFVDVAGRIYPIGNGGPVNEVQSSGGGGGGGSAGVGPVGFIYTAPKVVVGKVLGISTTTMPTIATPKIMATSTIFATSTTKVFVTTLSRGSVGAEVKMLQAALTAAGYYNASVTGYFGALTEAAVIKYQTVNGISPTGVVGPKTRAMLNKI